MRPSTMPKLSLSTFATGARQFVVHDAFDTNCISDLNFFWFTTSTFKYKFSAYIIPFQGCRIFLLSYADTLSVYNKMAILNFNFTLESAVNGVVLKHISNIICIEEIVDSDYFYIVPLKGSPEG